MSRDHLDREFLIRNLLYLPRLIAELIIDHDRYLRIKSASSRLHIFLIELLQQNHPQPKLLNFHHSIKELYWIIKNEHLF